MIVNTATKCGFSSQFEGIKRLYQKYKNKNFEIIGFPCHQFANQEPESNETMAETCRINFGVTFLLSEKIFVNDKDTHPIFAFLKNNAGSFLFGEKIKWNFTKFLISPNGEVIKRYAPITDPSQIEKDIIVALDYLSENLS